MTNNDTRIWRVISAIAFLAAGGFVMLGLHDGPDGILPATFGTLMMLSVGGLFSLAARGADEVRH